MAGLIFTRGINSRNGVPIARNVLRFGLWRRGEAYQEKVSPPVKYIQYMVAI
jgi:hypothetical protein